MVVLASAFRNPVWLRCWKKRTPVFFIYLWRCANISHNDHVAEYRIPVARYWRRVSGLRREPSGRQFPLCGRHDGNGCLGFMLRFCRSLALLQIRNCALDRADLSSSVLLDCDCRRGQVSWCSLMAE